VEIADCDKGERGGIGKGEGDFCEDEELRRLGGSSLTFGPNDIDLSSYLPRDAPFTLRVSAVNYGSPGWVSDVFLILRPR